MTAPLRGISIVCVFNNPAVRRECLDRSIEAYGGVVDVDYIPVDNQHGAFTSAGAALNHGARQARHEVVVFVHQDVYLHSIDRLADVAQAFADGSWGLLGANGIDAHNVSVGRLRDRTQVIGVSAEDPVDVDSVDEVLFMVPRSQILAHPLIEAADLAWHAYGVEYSLRLRTQGLRVGAVNLAITHNSLTVNLAKLDLAHQRVVGDYPLLVPIHTTCGTIGGRRPWFRSNPVARRHSWRLRWLLQSVSAIRARRRLGVPVVLTDIRMDVDLISLSSGTALHVVNVDAGGGFAEYASTPLEVTRHGQRFVLHTVTTASEVERLIPEVPTDDIVLVVGMGLADLEDIRRAGPTDRPCLLGVYPGDVWLLLGVPADRMPVEWSRPTAAPLGSRTLAGSFVG